MLPSRFGAGQPSNIRKSKIDARPSMLPKPRRPGSMDRHSGRSSSAEPSRATYAGGRLSRDSSVSKLPMNARSRSQQADRFTTPLHSNQHSKSTATPRSQQRDRFMTPRSSQYSRPTGTPRTPSEERSRNWQTCLERVLAFVTIKDERPLSSAAWQRAEFTRVSQGLAARGVLGGGAGGAGGTAVLIRPLTIARFVDIIGDLVAHLAKDSKLNTDNYVTKLPHLTKRLLYPGTVSKSWLKTVNTLHAFPNALGLISYLMDLVNHIELPVSDDSLYMDQDELARLRRDYLLKCWHRFQSPAMEGYDDLDKEYLLSLKDVLGDDDAKIAELKKTIHKYECCLEDESEMAARDDEIRRVERYTALVNKVKEFRADLTRCRANIEEHRHRNRQLDDQLAHFDADIERLSAEKSQLKLEVESQRMSVEERTRLVAELEYSQRVRDSKQALAKQINTMVQNKEAELALWQKKTLDSCIKYKQGLIHMSSQYPDLATLAVDEKDLMEAECANRVSVAVETLRKLKTTVSERRAEQTRTKAKITRKRNMLLTETRTKLSEVKSSIQKEQEALDFEVSKENAEASEWTSKLHEINLKLAELRCKQDEYAKVENDLEFWEKQNIAWCTKLKEMQDYIKEQRENVPKLLEEAIIKRVKVVEDMVEQWESKL